MEQKPRKPVIPEERGECQRQVLYDTAKPLGPLERARLITLRLLTAVEARLGRRVSVGDGPFFWVGDPTPFERDLTPRPDAADDGSQIQEGDIVEVLPWEEIEKTLDSGKRYKGLEFMMGMKKFCGKQLRVLRPVRAIHDERVAGMLRIKDCYLLVDCLCDGKGMYIIEGCDRCCYYFWKDVWLKKVAAS